MGQVWGKLQDRLAEARDPHRDSSIHSRRSVHPEQEGGDDRSDQDVLGSVVSEEEEVEGPHAALQAAREFLESEELAGPEAAALARLAMHSKGKDLELAEAGALPDGEEPESLTCRALKDAAEASARLGEAEAPSRKSDILFGGVRWHLAAYFRRMRGGVDKPAKIPKPLPIVLAWLGAFSSILVISVLRTWVTQDIHFDFLVASFGASAVLVFGAPEGKLSQPRNLIGGHVVSAVVGCTVRLVLKDVIWLSSAVGMALALSAMQLTKTLHPPGGATALIAASANPLPRGAGYSIVLVVLIDALIMLIVGLAVNNIQHSRRYPTYWF